MTIFKDSPFFEGTLRGRFREKKKEIVGDSIFGSRFWLPDLVVRSSSFFMFLSFLAAGRAESVLELPVLFLMRAGRS